MSNVSNGATSTPRNWSVNRSKDVECGGMHSVEVTLKRAIVGAECLVVTDFIAEASDLAE
jgi:hypothetical protein